MIKTIIFDVGGTLADGPDLYHTISDKVENLHGLRIEAALSEQFGRMYAGKRFYAVKTILDKITRKILKDSGVEKSKIKASDVYKDIYLNKSCLFSDSLEILDFLKNNGIQLIIVSDADADVMIPELKMLKIFDYFDSIIISSDVNCYKTSKDMANLVNHLLKAPKEQVLFVGNANEDISAAKNLGIKSVFINRVGDKKLGDITIRSLIEIKNLVN